MNRQITDTMLMIRPAGFYGNEQTAVNNYFQQVEMGSSKSEVQVKAVKEFDAFVDVLVSKGVEVLFIEDTAEPSTPDAVFPNNWISFHEEGNIFMYPMFAPNRRQERRADIIERVRRHFLVSEVIKLDSWEVQGHFLEGTGSLILDRPNKVAYVALSDRAHLAVIRYFEKKTHFQVVTFRSNQEVKGKRLPIYHTNVMMYVGEAFAVVCLDSIDNSNERESLILKLENTGKEIIAISEKQVTEFAGNGLQVVNKRGDRFIVMSTTALNSLNQNQQKALEKNGEIIHSPLDTIEHYGGGSARCMMAEIFLRKKDHV